MSNSSSLKQLKSALQFQLQKSKDLSLFDKLQIYDRIVAQSKLKPTDNKALSIFQQLIYEHGNTIMKGYDLSNSGNQMANIKQKGRILAGSVYSSPPNIKNELKDIQDPQLFSFSKTRKETQSKYEQMTQNGTLRTNMFNNAKNNKSAYPRYHIPHAKQSNQRKVSQFNSQYTAENNQGSSNRNNNQLSLHQLTQQLKTYLLQKNMNHFIKLTKFNLNANNKKLNLKTSESIYQLNLLRKSMISFKQYNKEAKATIQEFQTIKNQQKLLAIFNQWYNYANRSEDQRLREKQVKAKKTLLMKTLGIKTFISNTVRIIELKNDWNQQNMSFQQYESNQKNQLQNKKNKFIKWIAVKKLLQRQNKSKLLNLNIVKLKHLRMENNFNIFYKLVNCLKDSQQLRNEKITQKLAYKINSMHFIHKLKKQYYFQKAYWTNVNHAQMNILEKSKQNNYLNYSYKKILFIFEVLDCVQHNLNRKGYLFLQNQHNLNQSLLQTIKLHPAYQQFYKRYKLHSYFNALKNVLLKQTKQKINTIKYDIIGNRVLKSGLLSWYKNYLQQQVFNANIQQKYNMLNEYLRNKNIKQFYKIFSTKINTDRCNQLIQTNLYHKNVIKTLMIFKTYAISKKYYRTIILQSKLNKKRKTLENYFVEWKLYYFQNMHNRLLQKDISIMRKKSAIRMIKQNIQQHSLPDRIYRKKCLNLINLKKNDSTDRFITLLRKNWQIKQKTSRQSKAQLNSKINEIRLLIQQNSQRKFLFEMTQNWYQAKIQYQIENKIDQQYSKRLLFKVFCSMKSMVKIQKIEKQKLKAIIQNKQSNTKKQTLQKMIQKLIQKLILNKMVKVIRIYWFDRFKQAVKQNKLIQQSYDSSQIENGKRNI